MGSRPNYGIRSYAGLAASIHHTSTVRANAPVAGAERLRATELAGEGAPKLPLGKRCFSLGDRLIYTDGRPSYSLSLIVQVRDGSLSQSN